MGLYGVDRDAGKEVGSYYVGVICGYTGIMEKKMEATNYIVLGYILGLYGVYIGIMEKKMESTI